MKKRVLTMTLALAMCLTLFAANALAATTTEKISIKIPGCNATFTLENVSEEYGLVQGNVPEYIFAFPGENGKVTCDTRAAVDLYGEFHGEKANAGGGVPTMEAGWSRGYDFADDGPGEGVTLVTVFALPDGSLSLSEDTSHSDETHQAKITFGTPSSILTS